MRRRTPSPQPLQHRQASSSPLGHKCCISFLIRKLALIHLGCNLRRKCRRGDGSDERGRHCSEFMLSDMHRNLCDGGDSIFNRNLYARSNALCLPAQTAITYASGNSAAAASTATAYAQVQFHASGLIASDKAAAGFSDNVQNVFGRSLYFHASQAISSSGGCSAFVGTVIQASWAFTATFCEHLIA